MSSEQRDSGKLLGAEDVEKLRTAVRVLQVEVDCGPEGYEVHAQPAVDALADLADRLEEILGLFTVEDLDCLDGRWIMHPPYQCLDIRDRLSRLVQGDGPHI